MEIATRTLGQNGEAFAARWLCQHKGWNIVARNVHAPGGEIDIIAYNPREVLYVLVEVKTRRDQRFALGVEAVGPKKQQRMQRAAAHYFLKQLGRKEVPEFEMHALVLVSQATSLPWQSPFKVEYYDDLS